MRKVRLVMISAVAATLLLGGATTALAQSSRTRTIDPILRGNPKRDAGGSCVYNRYGQVVFAPEGKKCRDRRDHLATVRDVNSDLVADFPPAMRQELARLLSDHDHIAEDVAQLREAIRTENRESALKAAEKVSQEITDHTAREELFLEGLSRRSAAAARAK